MPEVDDRSLMNMALEEARAAADLGEVPIGAVLVSGDAVIRGHNRVIIDSDPTAHAEIVVMREAAKRFGNYRLVGSSLYVTLEPCIMCAGAIIQARINRLVYAAQDPRYGAVESMLKAFDFDVNHKPDICSGILKEEAGELLTKFFQERRNGGVPKWS
ncbi:MAG TPA: tRNA adenosine(34) deaminase TadA [Deltaproteobacteria bacterium]|nr:tRNA adenosine(34) deaminase TadA [Deltaproteobacteria bacterium]